MINYQILNESIDYYSSMGFKRIESPWMVDKGVSDITKPVEFPDFTVKEEGKCLVASGEQSFLDLYNKGLLPKGRFQTITPCFRKDKVDEWHLESFIKNELIITDFSVNQKELEKTINIAADFFLKYIPEGFIRVVATKEGFDINYFNAKERLNIELGSYGIRECSFLKWIYATGCAEPRLSRVIQRYGLS